jgi:hypothetical protein
MVDPPTDPRTSEWQSRWWNDTTIVIAQGIPGESTPRNFTFSRKGGPSMGELCGGFLNQVPSGSFSVIEPLYDPNLGRRETYADDGTQQRIRTGLCLSNEEQDSNTTSKEEGLLSTLLVGWQTRPSDLGPLRNQETRYYPSGNIGRTHVYQYGYEGNGMHTRCRLSSIDEEMFVTGVDIDAPADSAVVERIERMFL